MHALEGLAHQTVDVVLRPAQGLARDLERPRAREEDLAVGAHVEHRGAHQPAPQLELEHVARAEHIAFGIHGARLARRNRALLELQHARGRLGFAREPVGLIHLWAPAGGEGRPPIWAGLRCGGSDGERHEHTGQH